MIRVYMNMHKKMLLKSPTFILAALSYHMPQAKFCIVADITRFGQPSACLDSADVRAVSKLAEVSTESLRLVAHRFVADRLDAPMAEVMTQDCTPLRTATMHVGGRGDLRVVRRGRQGREFFGAACFLDRPYWRGGGRVR